MSIAHNPVILTYHSIAEGLTPIEIPPLLFARQMEWLAENARVAPLADVVEALVARRPLPARTVVLTFDDGFADFFSAAAPVLQQHNFPATVFLPTGHCGRTNRWPGQPSWVRVRPLMSWLQIAELAHQGIVFGAHSVSHPDLTAITLAELQKELSSSRSEIESHTHRAADFFCYPYGRWNESVRDAVRKTYRGACSTAAGVIEPDADPFALPRVDAHYVRNMSWFRKLFAGSFRAYVSARRLVRRLRGQPEGKYARV